MPIRCAKQPDNYLTWQPTDTEFEAVQTSQNLLSPLLHNIDMMRRTPYTTSLDRLNAYEVDELRMRPDHSNNIRNQISQTAPTRGRGRGRGRRRGRLSRALTRLYWDTIWLVLLINEFDMSGNLWFWYELWYELKFVIWIWVMIRVEFSNFDIVVMWVLYDLFF